MHKSFLSSALAINCVVLFSTTLASYGQGMVEHSALNGGVGALTNSVNNKSTIDSLSKIYKKSYSFSGSSSNKGNTGGLSYVNHSTNNNQNRHSAEEIKAAAEESNKFYRLAEQKEKAAKFDEAKQLYYKSAIARTHVWGDSDPAVAKITLKIGEIELKQKHPDEARAWYKRTLTALSKRYGSGDYKLVPVLSKLAILDANEKKYEDASTYYDHILLLQEREFGQENQKCVPIRITLIQEYMAANDLYEADKVAKKALAIETKERGIASPDYSKLEQLSTQITALRASNSSK